MELVIKNIKDNSFLAGTPGSYYWSTTFKRAIRYTEDNLPLAVWGMFYNSNTETYEERKPVAKVITVEYAEHLLAEEGTLSNPLLGNHWVHNGQTLETLIRNNEIPIFRTKKEAGKTSLVIYPSYVSSRGYIIGNIYLENPNEAHVIVNNQNLTFTFTGIE